MFDNNTSLVAGSSGVGKTTQAELWGKYRRAEIINRDRCVIAKRGEQFWGCGSPYSSSSGIYRQKEAPIRAIILPEKAAENRIERITAQEAFLYMQSRATFACIVKGCLSDGLR